MKLEICCTSVRDVEAAIGAGADRVELCKDLSVGGLTPEENSIQEISQLGLPVMVLIRPHARGFVYTVDEQQRMVRSCEKALNAGAHGLVIGGLTEHNEIDGDLMETVRKTFPETPLTFHRAIDETRDINRSFNYLVSIGIERVLTSGGTANVSKGAAQLAQLHQEYGHRIIVLAGGGLRSSNVAEIKQGGIQEFHTSARTERTSNQFADPEEIKAIRAILQRDYTE